MRELRDGVSRRPGRVRTLGGFLEPLFTCFDIEATDLNASFGHTLCTCFSNLHTDAIDVFRLDDERYRGATLSDDSKLVEAVKGYMESAFCWLSWYGKMYDVPFLNTRLAMAGKKPIERRFHCDLIYYARKPFLALYSSKLDAMIKTFGLKEEKTALDPKIWTRAYELDKDAMDEVVRHCIQDVKALKEAFPILAPQIRNLHM